MKRLQPYCQHQVIVWWNLQCAEKKLILHCIVNVVLCIYYIVSFLFIALYFWAWCIGLYAVQSAMQQCPDSLPELLFLIWSRRQSLGRNWRPLPFSGALLLLLFQRYTFSQSGGLINWAGPIRECFLLEQSQRIDYNGKSRWFYRPTICHALISNEALDLKSGCVNVLAWLNFLEPAVSYLVNGSSCPQVRACVCVLPLAGGGF